MFADVFWCLLMSADVCWYLLMLTDICWCLPMLADVCWCLLMCAECRLTYLKHINHSGWYSSSVNQQLFSKKTPFFNVTQKYTHTGHICVWLWFSPKWFSVCTFFNHLTPMTYAFTSQTRLAPETMMFTSWYIRTYWGVVYGAAGSPWAWYKVLQGIKQATPISQSICLYLGLYVRRRMG